MKIDQLIVEIAQLKERVRVLEQAAFAAPDDHVEGWTRAAKIVGVNERTCKRRLASGNFPAPCRFDRIKRADGEDHMRPVWRRRALMAYGEGR